MNKDTVAWLDGVLSIDMEGQRAKYECLRPHCPRRLEGPVYSTDPVPGGEQGQRIGVAGVAAFIAGVKAGHLAAFHEETDR